MAEKQTMEKPSGWYKVARVLAGILMKVVFPVKFYGLDKLDAMEPPYMLICNHQSWLDPVCLLHMVKKYDVRFLAKKELLENKLIGGILNSMQVIGVDRHNSDMVAMRRCMQVLREGHILGVFPEGTRHKQGVMEELEGGAAMIALRSNAKVLPVWIKEKIRPFRLNHCYVGDVISLEDLREQGINKETCEKVLARFTQVYREMQKAV